MSKRILIVEDEESIADLERDYLELSGFQVEVANDGETGLNKAMKEEFDLIILDLMLPGVDGFEICREVRSQKNTPIIMVSAKKDDIDKIRGLGLGADDYMTKPFSPSELVARVKAHLSRYERLIGSNVEENDVIEIRGLKIDTTARRVWVNGEERSFFSFAKSRIGYRIQDCYDRNMGVKRHQVKEDGNVVTEKRKNISLDAVQEKFEKDGIGGSDWANIQSENTMKDPEELMEQDEKLLELTMLFTKITEHLTGRQNNENKQEYFRLFATENITGALKISEDTFFMKKRERDILSALKNDFLDYYMTEICRSMKKIHSCPMKKHCEVEVGSKDENEIEIPFSNKLYTAYFQRIQNRKVGDSAISMQRSSFKDLLSELYQVRS